MTSNLVDDGLLVLGINREGGTGAGELDDEDEEEDDHVEEEHDLVMFDGTDKTDHRDKEEEDTRGCDASNNGKVCDDSSDFTWAKSRQVKSRHRESRTYCEQPHR